MTDGVHSAGPRGKKVGLVGWLAAQKGVEESHKKENGRAGPTGRLARDKPREGRCPGAARWATRGCGSQGVCAPRALGRASRVGRGKRRVLGGLRKMGGAGWASVAGWASLFPILLSFLFSISYCFKSNSLLNACFTSSLIKQNESTLHHDATIKAPLGFYFTRFTYIKQNNSPLFEKKVEKKERKRVTPEFGGY
jgi:hypothetical protein